MPVRKFKKYEDLTLADDFMFKAVLSSNLSIAKGIVELALHRSVREIHFHGAEVESHVLCDGKKTRFDILLENEDAWIDLEMQIERKQDFAVRTKVYHGQLLNEELKEHSDYREVRGSVVIFLCMSDYFGKGKDVYRFENREEDSPDLKLEEGRITIFMNSDSNSKDPKTKAFLRYLKKSDISDTFTQTIEKAVRKVKESQNLRVYDITGKI